MPLQRLNQKPDVMASIADITCDSDGEITSFVGENGRAKYLPLHKIRKDEDYYIGFFLIGAYQEILGDLHNLFGDTNAVHITFNKKTGYMIDTVINGDATWETSEIRPVQGAGDPQARPGQPGEECRLQEDLHRGEQPLYRTARQDLLGYTYLGE